MDTLLWSIGTGDGLGALGRLWRPFLIGILLYYSGYLGVWLATLARAAGILGAFRPLAPGEAADALVVIPSLVRNRGDLEDLQAAASTVLGNGYPGTLVVCLAIDGCSDRPELVGELERWALGHRTKRSSRRHAATVLVARLEHRAGKGVAVAAGVSRAEHAVARGELARMPPVFFNMDADSVLGPQAIERMVAKLVRPSWLWRQRPIIVASNVLVRREHYWHGWAKLFTMRYQLALQVAREYLTSISLSRNNTGLLPGTAVSGALYCTWTELYAQQARHAAFMRSLRASDVIAWWFGARPPRLAEFTGEPNVSATAGPGDDTWLAWLALAARWRDGHLDLELPRSPLAALARLIRSLFVRPIAYDPAARVYTATPTTIRSLFKQRVRWNSSRLWLLQRFHWMPYFAWDLGFWIGLNAALTLMIHGVIVIGVLGWPFADRPATWLAIVAFTYATNLVIRGAATLLAMVQDHDILEHWHKLLALPLAGVFHAVFNIATTIVGIVQDFFFFGVNTGFAPEETLAESRTGRLAIGYRLCRCARLAIRALGHGDVPVGWFWLGWDATPWTQNGYAGWTNPARRARRGGVLPGRPRSSLSVTAASPPGDVPPAHDPWRAMVSRPVTRGSPGS
ncbi:MAG TPA: glycosyltransferase family 2 protein [Kofleriaceae bacterium]|nr:glycosyltransferase family 2 protein [Kofleriaceae bacterium]